MKSIKGIALIAVSIILTIYAWASAGMTNFIVPGLALTTLSLTFLLATRNALLEKWFHGIEKMYAYHKFTAIFSVVLLALHNVAMGGSLWGSHLAAQLGNVGIYLFVSIVLWPILVSTSNMRLGVGFIALSIWPISLVSSTLIC